jgi:hypothetical protein
VKEGDYLLHSQVDTSKVAITIYSFKPVQITFPFTFLAFRLCSQHNLDIKAWTKTWNDKLHANLHDCREKKFQNNTSKLTAVSVPPKPKLT